MNKHIEAATDPTADEGIEIPLSRITGECIAAAIKSLPPATQEARPQTVDTIAPLGVGPVRLYIEHFRPSAQLRRRGIVPFWVCARAWSRPLRHDDDMAPAGDA